MLVSCRAVGSRTDQARRGAHGRAGRGRSRCTRPAGSPFLPVLPLPPRLSCARSRLPAGPAAYVVQESLALNSLPPSLPACVALGELSWCFYSYPWGLIRNPLSGATVRIEWHTPQAEHVMWFGPALSASRERRCRGRPCAGVGRLVSRPRFCHLANGRGEDGAGTATPVGR